MGRIYRANLPFSAVTAAQDLLEVNVASTKAVRVLGLHLSQSTEIGDAQEEMLQVLMKEGATVSGSGGSTTTPVPRAKGDAAYAGTVEINNTTKANTGTIVTHLTQAWNIRVPLDIIFTPETIIELPPSARFTVELVGAPADSVTIGGWVDLEEIG